MPGALRQIGQALAGACGFDRAGVLGAVTGNYRAPDVEPDGAATYAWRAFDELTHTLLASLGHGSAQYLTGAAAEACASVKATAGRINSGAIYNSGIAAAYVQFHNLAAAPGGGAAPAMVLGIVQPGDTVQIPCALQGTVGLQIALSSTQATYTAYAFGYFLVWRD